MFEGSQQISKQMVDPGASCHECLIERLQEKSINLRGQTTLGVADCANAAPSNEMTKKPILMKKELDFYKLNKEFKVSSKKLLFRSINFKYNFWAQNIQQQQSRRKKSLGKPYFCNTMSGCMGDSNKKFKNSLRFS